MNNLTQQDIRTRERLQKQRANGNLDDDMKPYLVWLEGKRKPKVPQSHRTMYRKCLDIITEYMQNYTQREAIEHFGIYQSFIHRLQAKDYSRVPYQRVKQIVEENK